MLDRRVGNALVAAVPEGILNGARLDELPDARKMTYDPDDRDED